MRFQSQRRIRKRINFCFFLLLLLFLAAVCQAFQSIQSSRVQLQPSCHLSRKRKSYSRINVFSPQRRAANIPTHRYVSSGSVDNDSNSVDTNTTFAANATTSSKLAPSSGWANIGRFLLPSWHSSTESSAIANIKADGAIYKNTSAVEDESMHINSDDIIDVECRVDETEDCEPQSDNTEVGVEPQSDNTEVDVESLLNNDPPDSLVKQVVSVTINALFGGRNSTSDETTLDVNGAATSNATESNTSETTPSLDPEETTDSIDEPQTDTSQTKNHRSRRNTQESKWLNSLESKDIDTTTRSKQKKWARRQRRLIMMAKTVKNAMVLFVITFFLGNVMNQFVDLDEDGSFEVRFDKVLSVSPQLSPQTPTPAVPTPDPSPEKKKSLRTKPLFQTVSTSKLTYFTDINTKSQGMTLVSRAVRKIGPAVVRVETETDLDAKDSIDEKGESEKSEGYDGEGEDGDVFDGVPEAPPPSKTKSGPKNIDFGQGSGMIVNEDGYIVTNAHVVDGSNRIYITLTDGRRFRAELQGSDDIVDIAVLKIVPESDQSNDIISNLPVVQLGDSDQLEVGQFVTAIGCPGGLDNTCTVGIISGLKRCPNTVGIPDKMGVLDYIQTDAAINQGNSGGALVDVESSTVVGINTCIRANMEGTSFAIPTNKILAIVDDLANGITPTHGYLGVDMVSVTTSH